MGTSSFFKGDYIRRDNHVYKTTDLLYIHDKSICGVVWSLMWPDCKCSYCYHASQPCQICDSFWIMLELGE